MLSCALAIFLALEFALQVRAHLRYGQSIFNALSAETQYVTDESLGLKLLRPNRRFRGSVVTIQTNSLGLRGREVTPGRAAGSLRIAVIGASSVMGAFAANNDATFSALLEARLRRQYPGRTVEVINAGIAGLALGDQRVMLERMVAPLRPDLVIVYPGFNDFSGYCRGSEASASRGTIQSLHEIRAPKWLLTVDLLVKNTMFLRDRPKPAVTWTDPLRLDTQPYRRELNALLISARRLGIPLAISTNARAFRPEQPLSVQQRLSETARYVNPCFDASGLNTLHDTHNDFIAKAALAAGVPLLRMDRRIPGGTEYFADSSHFSAAGERLVADLLFGFLTAENLLPRS